MAYGIAAAASRLARLVRGEGAAQDRTRLALVLRVENLDMLRASIGPVLLEQMLDKLLLRLVAELRLLPQARAAGSGEILGLLAVGRHQAVPGLLARLQAILSGGIELPDLRVCPVVNAAIVRCDGSPPQPAALYARGRLALQGLSPVFATGQIRFVEMQPQADPAALPDGALERLCLLFQPQLCCDTGQVLALRVAPRMRMDGQDSCDLAALQPRLDDGTLGRIVAEMLRQALAALRGWDRLGVRVPVLSVPLTDRMLADAAIADMILWELDRHDLVPARLEIEMTEPIGRSGGRMPVTTSLQRLTAAGCALALGEFGTGSAGLDDLRRFGIGRVRIGRTFIADCDRSAEQQRMILAMLALAEHLDLATLADGVSTPEENAFLAQIGFSAVQGPAVVPAMEAGAVDDFLLDHDLSLPAPFVLGRKA
ncbi:EAL domain, c-di-GMP-specific phosphodiesterase class I (or its enzymatically inactive variant) [Paracoccus thiocyanatus]|uniref:EAL domain, c-di-GMP-specific phosphodiesterase class I (Or its enzymatically inactive variant) n=1 Tax=Paracoccus thiocyanatus TaxID=34006 RepID=A0A1N6SM30_9RHOB|nr:EAL domain-containing protein [Paracoccus thiocyanatus]SIQ42155.1 EAL domain, c-di-GMP-specific phosphodiesterase class I (or its enzymatically inactive variant) [Paracoccus thiocyanatus]